MDFRVYQFTVDKLKMSIMLFNIQSGIYPPSRILGYSLVKSNVPSPKIIRL
jgi:hypothetical protein